MIPPVAPSVLTANPQFALLHTHLTAQLLYADASTRSISIQHEPVTKQLKRHHVQAAKDDVLKRSLHSILADETLPPELKELVLTISTYLTEAPNMNLSHEAHVLMGPEVEAFKDNLHILAPLLSKHIQHERDSLLPLAATSASPSKSTKPRISSSSPLSTDLTTRLTALHPLQTHTLPSTAVALSNTLSTLLTTHTTHLSALIRHLELHTLGTESRHGHARATYLSAVAAGLDAKLQLLALQARQSLYTPAVQRALTNYSTHLRGMRQRLREREERLRSELELYEDAGGDGLRECAKRYGVVEREIEVVKGEVARLEVEHGRRQGVING